MAGQKQATRKPPGSANEPRSVEMSAREAERRARERAEAVAGQLARLEAVTAALSATLTPVEVGRVVLECGRDTLAARRGSLWWEGEGHALNMLASIEPARNEAAPEQSSGGGGDIAAQAWRAAEVVWPEAGERPANGRSGAPGETAWTAVPLFVRGRVMGALAFSLAQERRLSPEDKSFALALGQQCAHALERARLYESQRALRAAAEESAALARRTLRERDESTAVLDALFATAPVGLAVLDRELRFVRINPALAQMNGSPPDRHFGRTLWEVVPGVASEALIGQLKSVMDSCQPLLDQAVEGETPAAPGQQRHWLGSWFPVSVAGKVIGVGLLVREVTQQRQAEEFQRQLLGIVGHDLRSPLLAITCSASILQHRPLHERDARAVGRIHHAANRIDGIIGALTDYSQVRVGRGIPLHLAPADLAEIGRSVAEEVEAGHPGRVVSCVVVGDVRGEWDAGRLGQVLANLAANALKYGADGTPVRVECRGEDGHVVVEVHNDGEPIPADFMPHLFQAFRRSDQASVGGKTGLGLGLFIARQIVLAHGGSLEARSSEDEGTVFTLRLPRRAPPANGSR